MDAQKLKQKWPKLLVFVILSAIIIFVVLMLFLPYFSYQILGVTQSVNNNAQDPTSMHPSINRADMLIIYDITPSELKVGDIVMFENHGSNIIHRIQQIYQIDNDYYFVIKGDNSQTNNILDIDDDSRGYLFHEEKIIGKVIMNIPRIGSVFLFISENKITNRFIFTILFSLTILISIFYVKMPELDNEHKNKTNDNKITDIRLMKAFLAVFMNHSTEGENTIKWKGVFLGILIFMSILVPPMISIDNEREIDQSNIDISFTEVFVIDSLNTPVIKENQYVVMTTLSMLLPAQLIGDYKLRFQYYEDVIVDTPTNAISQEVRVEFDDISGNFSISLAMIVTDQEYICNRVVYKLIISNFFEEVTIIGEILIDANICETVNIDE